MGYNFTTTKNREIHKRGRYRIDDDDICTCWLHLCIGWRRLGVPFIVPRGPGAVAPSIWILLQNLHCLCGHRTVQCSTGARSHGILLPPSFCADGHRTVRCTIEPFGTLGSRWRVPDYLLTGLGLSEIYNKNPNTKAFDLTHHGSIQRAHRTVLCSLDSCTLKCYFLLFFSI
jgi:hypothetical protein